jgi:glucose-1-phosphate thymidylyltransferase
MRGIILAGGTGSRLFPITLSVSKQLLPIYDKPMIYYPISTLMLAGIREILIITTPEDINAFQKLLGDGSQFGVSFTYKSQSKPNGLAEAFIIGEEFIDNKKVALILGDNIFHGVGLGKMLTQINQEEGAIIFACNVSTPENYGVVEFSEDGEVISIEEKPESPKSNFAIPGLYFYDGDVVSVAKGIKPSNRGELEITSVNQHYLDRGMLRTIILTRGTTWLDTGTPQSLNDASNFVRVIEERTGLKIGCLEEIAYNLGWIGLDQLLNSIEMHQNNNYGNYLRMINP